MNSKVVYYTEEQTVGALVLNKAEAKRLAENAFKAFTEYETEEAAEAERLHQEACAREKARVTAALNAQIDAALLQMSKAVFQPGERVKYVGWSGQTIYAVVAKNPPEEWRPSPNRVVWAYLLTGWTEVVALPYEQLSRA